MTREPRPEGWLSRTHKQGRPGYRRARLVYLRWRFRLDARPRTALAYRIAVGAIGVLVTLIGLTLVPLPGPGWLIVLIGLAMIASEFSPARRLLHFARLRIDAWGRWVAAQPLWVRGALALGTCLVVWAACWAALLITGLPTWVPADWVPAWTGLAHTP